MSSSSTGAASPSQPAPQTPAGQGPVAPQGQGSVLATSKVDSGHLLSHTDDEAESGAASDAGDHQDGVNMLEPARQRQIESTARDPPEDAVMEQDQSKAMAVDAYDGSSQPRRAHPAEEVAEKGRGGLEDGAKRQEELKQSAADLAPESGASLSNHHAPQPSSGKGSAPRNVAVKRYDGEPLVRADLQHNVITRIFADTTRCFTNPRPGPEGPQGSKTWKLPTPVYPQGQAATTARRSDETPEEFEAWKSRSEAWEKAQSMPAEEQSKQGWPRPGAQKLTFKELYLENLLHAGKCTQAMRQKMTQDEAYAEDFAKACFLVNVGRINTTLAFYPEMKTILRSYHPLPSLQRNENTQRHMQDAPRMKSLLKSCLLDTERPAPAPGATAERPTGKGGRSGASGGAAGRLQADRALIDLPSEIAELVERRHDEHAVVPTGVVQAIFILLNRPHEVTTLHFEQPHDMYTLFFPHEDYPVPSEQRARAFLWLMWHYLEGGAGIPNKSGQGKALAEQAERNPFEDEHAAAAREEARRTWEKLDSSERSRARKVGYWQGTPNPAWAEHEAREQKREAERRERELRRLQAEADKAAAEAAASAAAAQGEGTPAPPQGEGTREPNEAEPAAGVKTEPIVAAVEADAARPAGAEKPVDADENAEQPDGGGVEVAPPRFLHRLLAPRLDMISAEASRKENEDPEEEVEWGRAMQDARQKFLLRFQREEQAKANAAAAAAAAGGPGELAPSLAYDGHGATLAEEEEIGGKKGRKRTSMPASTSNYPLAQIVAMAKDNANPMGPMPAPEEAGEHGHKRRRMSERPDSVGFGAERAATPPLDMWQLDLAVPLPPNGHARNRNQSAAAAVAAVAAAQSLPRTAWRRILERAQRGIGDASFQSDDEGVADDEARDERPRGELARVLATLRTVRTLRGEIAPPRVLARVDEDAAAASAGK